MVISKGDALKHMTVLFGDGVAPQRKHLDTDEGFETL
jgi:hypothetical protein